MSSPLKPALIDELPTSTTTIGSSILFYETVFMKSKTVLKISMNESEKDAYYTQRAIDLQKGILSYKSASTKTSEAYIWTYRTTACDVLSVITTTVPIKNGVMKEINIETKKVIRFVGTIIYC